MGRSRTIAAEISAPSPRTTIKGASMPIAARCRSQAATSRSIIPIRRAFSTAVSARFGPFSCADSSCEQVTGRPVTRRIRARAATSWDGLRVAKRDATAKPITSSARPETAASSASRSSGAVSCPAWPCPPASRITGSPRSASVRPPRSRSPSSKPMKISATRPPCPSTRALVARVVDSDTSRTSRGATPAPDRAASTARPMPSARSPRVVSDLAEPITRSAASSTITASV